MRKLFISAGHSPKKPGAQGNGFKEELLTIELRDLIFDELSALGVKATIDPNDNALAETINFFRKLINSNSVVLDIHFNSAASALATGTETLIPEIYTRFEYNLASSLSNAVSSVLGIRLRGSNGVKTEIESHHGKLAWMRMGAENILMEICFISNPSDMASYQANKVRLAKEIAKTIKDHLNK